MKDAAETYYPSFKGKSCELRSTTNRLVRKFLMKAEIVNAQVSGAGKDSKVAITCKDGKTYVYTASGRLVRS